MATLFLLVPLVASFMAINLIIGCYVAIRLGCGPPNWQTALNQIVPLTMLQDYLNEGRDWIEKKAPKVDALLNRLHIPKLITFIDTTIVEEDEEVNDVESNGEVAEVQAEEPSDVPAEEDSDKSESKPEADSEIPTEKPEKVEA